jgi:hypothetical protein
LADKQRAKAAYDQDYIDRHNLNAKTKAIELRAHTEQVAVPTATAGRQQSTPLGAKDREPPRQLPTLERDKFYAPAQLQNLSQLALNLGVVTDILARRARLEDAKRSFGDDGEITKRLASTAFDGAAAIADGLHVVESGSDAHTQRGFGQGVLVPSASQPDRPTRIRQLTQELIQLKGLADRYKQSGATRTQVEEFNNRLEAVVAELNRLGADVPALGTIRVPPN